MESELEKCLMCKNPQCAKCPAGTDVAKAIWLVRGGKPDEAGEMLFDNNPLSAITGAVCPNHLFCKGGCVLGRRGNAVDFGQIEREVSKRYLDIAKPVQLAGNGKKVLVVGSGPAGLALAYYIKKGGFDVEVWERENKFGGMLRYGIPDFRLDKRLIDKVVSVLRRMGVQLNTGIKVDLKKLPSGFDIIVLAIGAGVSRRLEIEGSEHAIYALDYLKNPTTSKKFVVIGAGNVAIDCALTAAELGAESVNLCYRKDEAAMKAYPEELAYARDKGVVFNYFMVPKKIIAEGVLFENGTFMPADKIVVAIGQGAVNLDDCPKVGCTPNGLIQTDGFKTNVEDVYALGDAVTGTSTIIQVVAQAKELAKIILAEAEEK